jgi:hypothetical protein
MEIGFLVTAAGVALAWLAGWHHLARGAQREEPALTAPAPTALVPSLVD